RSRARPPASRRPAPSRSSADRAAGARSPTARPPRTTVARAPDARTASRRGSPRRRRCEAAGTGRHRSRAPPRGREAPWPARGSIRRPRRPRCAGPRPRAPARTAAPACAPCFRRTRAPTRRRASPRSPRRGARGARSAWATPPARPRAAFRTARGRPRTARPGLLPALDDVPAVHRLHQPDLPHLETQAHPAALEHERRVRLHLVGRAALRRAEILRVLLHEPLEALAGARALEQRRGQLVGLLTGARPPARVLLPLERGRLLGPRDEDVLHLRPVR